MLNTAYQWTHSEEEETNKVQETERKQLSKKDPSQGPGPVT